MTEKIYTTDEVAKICHVKKETVRDWLKTGKLAGTKRGRAYLITETSLREYLEIKHG